MAPSYCKTVFLNCMLRDITAICIEFTAPKNNVIDSALKTGTSNPDHKACNKRRSKKQYNIQNPATPKLA